MKEIIKKKQGNKKKKEVTKKRKKASKTHQSSNNKTYRCCLVMWLRVRFTRNHIFKCFVIEKKMIFIDGTHQF